MPINKNALIRYKTIDSCLQNTYRKWTLDDLIEACSEALFEFEGKESYVSKRTIQLDLQTMRSDKLGYEAPIEVYDRKYYRYSQSDFSIKNIMVSEHDLQTMNNAVQILKQFKDFSMFQDMNGVIQKLEDSILAKNQKAIIHLDKNERLKGLDYIDTLYQAISQKKVLKIAYKSFKARTSSEYISHPQLLKEYNNRWFVLIWSNNKLFNFALDRIESVTEITDTYQDLDIDPEEYYKNIVGVTVTENMRTTNVDFLVDSDNIPYVLTKPLHSSQYVLKQTSTQTIFRIHVQLNLELERLLLGFGESITIIFPLKLRNRIQQKLKKAVKNYEN